MQQICGPSGADVPPLFHPSSLPRSTLFVSIYLSPFREFHVILDLSPPADPLSIDVRTNGLTPLGNPPPSIHWPFVLFVQNTYIRIYLYIYTNLVFPVLTVNDDVRCFPQRPLPGHLVPLSLLLLPPFVKPSVQRFCDAASGCHNHAILQTGLNFRENSFMRFYLYHELLTGTGTLEEVFQARGPRGLPVLRRDSWLACREDFTEISRGLWSSARLRGRIVYSCLTRTNSHYWTEYLGSTHPSTPPPDSGEERPGWTVRWRARVFWALGWPLIFHRGQDRDLDAVEASGDALGRRPSCFR